MEYFVYTRTDQLTIQLPYCISSRIPPDDGLAKPNKISYLHLNLKLLDALSAYRAKEHVWYRNSC